MVLYVITGPMFAGKTQLLLHLYFKCKTSKLAIRHYIDQRYVTLTDHAHKYTVEDDVVSDRIEMNYAEKSIFIDEGQFFDNLHEACRNLLKEGHDVYVTGLNGDRFQNQWTQIALLLPLASYVILLKGRCRKCQKQEAIFTLADEPGEQSNQIKVGGTDEYFTLCPDCFFSGTA